MPSLSFINLYLNVYAKAFVSVSGSPISVPAQFYGDKPTFNIFPVVPFDSNPSHGYVAYDASGSTMNFTMADVPNAASPPTPFAEQDGIAWNAASKSFSGQLDLTQAAVGTFIGASAGKQAYFNLDILDVTLARTTLIQTTFQMNASIDAVAAGPPGPVAQYATLAQLANLFATIAAVPAKHIDFQSPDGTKKVSLSLGNNGAVLWTPIN